MSSTTRRLLEQIAQEPLINLRWRNWPLREHAYWAWALALAMLAVGGAVLYVGGGWLLAAAAVVGLAGTLWPYWLPVGYEIDSLGLRRSVLRRSRLIPWHTVRAYRLRATGVVLYQRADPTAVDLLRSIFIPYPDDEDALLCALREHLPHAVELPK